MPPNRLPEGYYAMQPDPVLDHPNPAMRVWGWMAPAELDWLKATAATMGSVVEVGALHGRSTTALLEGCRGPVYAIDPWNDEHGRCLPSFLGACGGYPNCHPVQGYSPQVIDEYDLPDVDMTFLDGAHDADSVRADLAAWTPKTRRIICGHDYVPGGSFPDVAVVVDEVFGGRVKVAEGTAIWYVELGRQRSTRKAKVER